MTYHAIALGGESSGGITSPASNSAPCRSAESATVLEIENGFFITDFLADEIQKPRSPDVVQEIFSQTLSAGFPLTFSEASGSGTHLGNGLSGGCQRSQPHHAPAPSSVESHAVNLEADFPSGLATDEDLERLARQDGLVRTIPFHEGCAIFSPVVSSRMVTSPKNFWKKSQTTPQEAGWKETARILTDASSDWLHSGYRIRVSKSHFVSYLTIHNIAGFEC